MVRSGAVRCGKVLVNSDGFAVGEKLRINEKENNNLRIVCDLDKKNFDLFLKDIKKLAKKYEYKSNPNKLKHILVVNSISRANMECKGWSARTKDLLEVGFFDYDNILEWIMLEECRLLIKKHNLPPFYIFSTKEEIDNNGDKFGNYMAICLQKLPFFDWAQIKRETHTDEAHRIVAQNYRFFTSVLRLGPKGKKGNPKFKCVIGDLEQSYNQPISKPHLETLHNLYPEIPKIKYTNKDKFNEVYTCVYHTGSK